MSSSKTVSRLIKISIILFVICSVIGYRYGIDDLKKNGLLNEENEKSPESKNVLAAIITPALSPINTDKLATPTPDEIGSIGKETDNGEKLTPSPELYDKNENIIVPKQDTNLQYFGESLFSRPLFTLSDGTQVIFESNEIKVSNRSYTNTICSDTSTRPIISDDRNKFAYISPYGLYRRGEIWVYFQGEENPVSLTGAKYFPNSTIPKTIEWLDNNTIIGIFGYPNGSLTSGVYVYLIDIFSKKNALFYSSELREIIESITIDDNRIFIETIKYSKDYLAKIFAQKVFSKQEAKDRLK